MMKMMITGMKKMAEEVSGVVIMKKIMMKTTMRTSTKKMMRMKKVEGVTGEEHPWAENQTGGIPAKVAEVGTGAGVQTAMMSMITAVKGGTVEAGVHGVPMPGGTLKAGSLPGADAAAVHLQVAAAARVLQARVVHPGNAGTMREDLLPHAEAAVHLPEMEEAHLLQMAEVLLPMEEVHPAAKILLAEAVDHILLPEMEEETHLLQEEEFLHPVAAVAAEDHPAGKNAPLIKHRLF